MSWCKVNLTCSSGDANIIEEIFLAHDAMSISMTDESGNNPIYELNVGDTPLWQIIELSALFEETISSETIGSFLEGIAYSNLIIKTLDNQNWIEKYQKNFKPIKFGKKLWVFPSWIKSKDNFTDIEIKIDPGMAFGSGSHETTSLCMEYLEKSNLDKLIVIDYGCGSGILAITSLKLGAKRAYAIDIDKNALSVTYDNAVKNKVQKKICITENLQRSNYADLLIANILAEPLLRLRRDFSILLKEGGNLILSGILENQASKIIQEYRKDFSVQNIEMKNEWCIIELKKISA